ncbi:MAG: hypothetical protein WA048_02910 [Minisyncoccia bacterium]
MSEEEIAQVLQSEFAQVVGLDRDECIAFILSRRKWEGVSKGMQEIIRLSQMPPEDVQDIVVRCCA